MSNLSWSHHKATWLKSHVWQACNTYN